MRTPTQRRAPFARVVLLDGYEETREATAKELRRSGFDVIAVEEEDEAVAAVTSPPPPADGEVDDDVVVVVVLDVPVAEAQEAARALLTSAPPSTERPAPKIIALVSPSDSRTIREAAHASGIDYVLLRPCPPAALANHLRRLLPPRALPPTQRR